ncbi:LLM class F420-dependent oxidoreductase [Nocardioides insulae]|uniref:LLM class F420-dependent oxidoreductase n=1 Tax=Nocardioides insulae TaxID=394734 RepID=UPI000415A100|nr:LLM class F420-dependent oxidoreductase [Nocardioides insulae]
MTRWGITIPLGDTDLARQGETYRELEATGYTDLWSAEGTGTEGFIPLGVAAAVTSTVHLGIAIAPAYTRGPALMAQTAATLAATAPGRVTIGIGSSSSTIVEQFNGIPFERPWSHCRDLLRFLPTTWAGEKVDATPANGFDTLDVRGFRLGVVPPEPPRLALAALRGRMLRLAGAEADGVIINWLSAEDVRTVVPVVAEAAGGVQPDVIARIMVVPTDDAERARAIGRRMITAYLNVPVYRAFQEWLGREELGPMWKLWEAGDRRGALEAIPDDVVDELIVHGSPEAIREHVQRYIDAGVTIPVMALTPVGRDPMEICRSLAPG